MKKKGAPFVRGSMTTFWLSSVGSMLGLEGRRIVCWGFVNTPLDQESNPCGKTAPNVGHANICSARFRPGPPVVPFYPFLGGGFPY